MEYSDAISGAKQIKLLGLAGIYSQMLTENIPNLRGLAVPYGLDYIPGSWMESIYVSKGTSSVKNGYESITGQINIEYKKPDEPEKFFINGYANQLGKIEGNINASHKVNSKLSTMLFAHAENFSNKVDMNKDGFLDQPLKNQYTFFNRWKYKGENILGQAGIRFLHEERTGGQTAFEKGMENVISNPYGINIETDMIEAFTKSAYLFKNRPGTNIGFINSFIHHK